MINRSNVSALEISSMIQSQYKSLKASNIQEDSQLRFFHIPTKRSNRQSYIQNQSQLQPQPEQEQVFLVENDIHEDMFVDQIPSQTEEYEYYHFDKLRQLEDRHQMEIQKYQEIKVHDIQKELERISSKAELFYQDLEGFDQKLNKFQDEFNKVKKQGKIERAKQKPFLEAKFGPQVHYDLFEPVLEQKDEKFGVDDVKIVLLQERNKNQELYQEIEHLKQKYQIYEGDQQQDDDSGCESSLVQSFETGNVVDQTASQKKVVASKKCRVQQKLKQNQFSQKYINQLNDNKNIQIDLLKNQQNKNGKAPLNNKNGKPPLNNKRPQSMKSKQQIMQLDNKEREKHLQAKIKSLYNKEIYK